VTSRHGRWLVAGTEGSDVTIWNATTGELVHTLKQSPNVWSVAFSPDGWRLATLSREGIVTVHDATRWEEMLSQEPFLRFPAHNTSVRGSLRTIPVEVFFSSSRRYNRNRLTHAFRRHRYVHLKVLRRRA
jgi:WD40 repeat protein